MPRPHTPELHSAEYEFLYSLAPRGNGIDRELFDTYFDRISPLISSIPRDVVEQWIHRHFPHGVLDFGWIGIRGLTFRRESWSANEILSNVGLHPGDDLVPKHEQLFRTNSPF